MRKIPITIDEQVYKYIKNNAVLYEEKEPNDTLRRLFSLNEVPVQPELEKLKRFRATLSQILNVWYLTQGGYQRTEATKIVAEKFGVVKQTIQDKYTRGLDLKTREFDNLSSEELRTLLVKKFPHYENEINDFFKDVLGESELGLDVA